MANCLECSVEFVPKRNSEGKFCSRSCSAKTNNRLFPKRYNSSKNRNCLNCEKPLIKSQKKFCSRHCNSNGVKQVNIEDWISGKVSGSKGNGTLRSCLRNYLVEKADNKCSKCDWGIPNPFIGKPILTIDHIDGNWMNNSYNNLVVLCYNCHTLTPTFGSLNKNGLFKEREGSFRVCRNMTDNANG